MAGAKTYAGQTVTAVSPGSPARRAGLTAGDVLWSINGEEVRDLIDYESLSAGRRLEIEYVRSGERLCAKVHKEPYAPLGLSFETTLMDRMQTCRNRCLFCFIDQMPKGIRSSLNVKDDDWRMSFIMGNYVSLTNISDEEFGRICRRRVSPLYISVHTVDGALRRKIMANPTADRLLPRLRQLCEAGITFHTQAVLCPGLNDGEVFRETVRVLSGMYPFCRSLAAVPVGLTRFREGLYPLRGFTKEESEAVLTLGEALQSECRDRFGDTFVYLSDEWYLNAGRELPPAESYGDFPQIENGVGLLRLFEQDLLDALKTAEPLRERRTVHAAGGTAAYPFFRELYQRLAPYGASVELKPVENRFFGGNVHVAGLVTGSDLIEAFRDAGAKDILIPANMLRERDSVFLDGQDIRDVEQALSARLHPFRDAYEFINLVLGETL